MILKAQAEYLLKDDTFTTVFDIIRQEQVKKFLKSSKSDTETREDAYAMTQALNQFENILKSAITNEVMKERKKQDSTVETTNQSIEDAVDALMAPVESEATETEAPEAEVAEVEEEEVEQEESESDDDAEYAEADDDDDDEYDESDDEPADQVEPDTYTVKVNGENVDVTLDDLRKSYSGQKYIQNGMKQAAEQRKQAEEAFNGLNQQREQLNQLMQQVEQQGVISQPTPPSKELLSADPLGYIEADATYREQMGAYQAQQQQIGQQQQAMQQQQGQAHQAHLQSQMAELQQAIPEFSDAKKAPKMKERLVKQGMAEGYTAEEIGGIVDHRAMKVLHKAMLYDQMMKGGGDVQAKLKKARPLMKAGTKKQPTTDAKKHSKQMSKLKKTGSVADAAALLFSS